MASLMARTGWICRVCRAELRTQACYNPRFPSFTGKRFKRSIATSTGEQLQRVRNIGIIAHIDAGKTTTTERMLYYSGVTRRIGDVDEGSTVTDFLPAERARGITIQSAAITFHWPPDSASSKGQTSKLSHTVNLIDTPGHADFTFEVIRSLRVLDGAICILDGVAGVEAQTEKVWHQANNYYIPRILYVNKLDRDGATFNRTVKEIASRLHTFPLLCQIPWWNEGKFVGVGDVVNLRGLLWESGGDGRDIKVLDLEGLKENYEAFATELLNAREALIEALTNYDEGIVEEFFEADSIYEAVPAGSILKSVRKCLLESKQAITPVFAGASFRNIGVQPLLDAINDFLPSPDEAPDPVVSVEGCSTTMRALMAGEIPDTAMQKISANLPKSKKNATAATTSQVDKLSGCALAFKVVTDARRGVLVYVRVYSGSITRNSLVYNTNLAVAERAQRLLRMHANDAIEIESIDEGQIGVITGLKYARTGDTLVVYPGANAKGGPPPPINRMQLQPIDVPPPLFFTSVEPTSLAEEKTLSDTMALLLREDPSLTVTVDPESGQTLMAGMGELHLEIARGRLLEDFKVKANLGEIQIGYREVVDGASTEQTATFDREIVGKKAEASCTASVEPLRDSQEQGGKHSHSFELPDSNRLTILHPTVDHKGKAATPEGTSMPADLPLATVLEAFKNGTTAALARGPTHRFPLNSTQVTIRFDPSQHLRPSSTSAALSSAARMAVRAALEASAAKNPTVMMEPVMLVTIAVTDETLGGVVHDLNAVRGGQVLSLDADEELEGRNQEVLTRRLSSEQLSRVYAPPDPFGSGSSTSDAGVVAQMRQIRARVPLKEMVGYLKHLRSLTAGRGTFVMSVDKFEKMSADRMKKAVAELRGGIF